MITRIQNAVTAFEGPFNTFDGIVGQAVVASAPDTTAALVTFVPALDAFKTALPTMAAVATVPEYGRFVRALDAFKTVVDPVAPAPAPTPVKTQSACQQFKVAYDAIKNALATATMPVVNVNMAPLIAAINDNKPSSIPMIVLAVVMLIGFAGICYLVSKIKFPTADDIASKVTVPATAPSSTGGLTVEELKKELDLREVAKGKNPTAAQIAAEIEKLKAGKRAASGTGGVGGKPAGGAPAVSTDPIGDDLKAAIDPKFSVAGKKRVKADGKEAAIKRAVLFWANPASETGFSNKLLALINELWSEDIRSEMEELKKGNPRAATYALAWLEAHPIAGSADEKVAKLTVKVNDLETKIIGLATKTYVDQKFKEAKDYTDAQIREKFTNLSAINELVMASGGSDTFIKVYGEKLKAWEEFKLKYGDRIYEDRCGVLRLK